MTEWREDSHKSYFFALSILIHLALFIAFLKVTNLDHQAFLQNLLSPELSIEKQEDTTIPSYQVAALKSRPSTFGAPVIFHEEPEIKAQDDSDGNDSDNQDGDQQEESHEMEQQVIVQESHIQENTQAEPQPELQEKKEEQSEKQKTTVTDAVEQNKEINIENKTEEKPKSPAPVKQVTQAQQVKPPAKKVIRKKVAQKKPGNSLRSASPIKKQLTLADLAEGFINTLNKGGQDWLDRDGDDSIRPDFQELKYLSYTRKVVWYMQNEWRATQDKLNIQLMHEYILSLIITFLKDGSVGNIRVVQESGCPLLDEFLIRGIRNAGPYPPLPQHFNSDSFDLPLNIYNAAQPSQPWRMSLPARQSGRR